MPPVTPTTHTCLFIHHPYTFSSPPTPLVSSISIPGVFAMDCTADPSDSLLTIPSIMISEEALSALGQPSLDGTTREPLIPEQLPCPQIALRHIFLGQGTYICSQ